MQLRPMQPRNMQAWRVPSRTCPSQGSLQALHFHRLVHGSPLCPPSFPWQRRAKGHPNFHCHHLEFPEFLELELKDCLVFHLEFQATCSQVPVGFRLEGS